MAQKIIQSIPYPYYTTIQRDELLDIEVNFKINNITTGKVEEWNGSSWNVFNERKSSALSVVTNNIDIDFALLTDFVATNRVEIAAPTTLSFTMATNAQFATFKVAITNLASITFPIGSISSDGRIVNRVFTPEENGKYCVSIYITPEDYDIVITSTPAKLNVLEKLIAISGTGQEKTDYILRLNLHTSLEPATALIGNRDVYLDEKCNSVFSDIKFLKEDGTELDFYRHAYHNFEFNYSDKSGYKYILPNGDILFVPISTTVQLQKSTDGGVTYSPLYTHNDSLGILFYDSRGYIFLRSGYKVLRSTNGGINFTEVWDMSDTNSVIIVSAFVEDGDGNLYFGEYQESPWGCRINKSTDGGENWTEVYNTASYQHVHSMLYDPNISAIYAGLDGTTGAIIKSTNAGTSWDIIKSGYGCDFTSAYAGNGFRLFGNGETGGTSGFGIMKTTDDSTFFDVLTCASPIKAIKVSGNNIFAFAPSYMHNRYPQIYVSTDNGDTWKTIKILDYEDNILEGYNRSVCNFENGVCYMPENEVENGVVNSGDNYNQGLFYVKIPTLPSDGMNIILRNGNGISKSIFADSVKDGLKGRWRLREGSGTVVNDSSGNNNHGSIVGSGGSWNNFGIARVGNIWPNIKRSNRSYNLTGVNTNKITVPNAPVIALNAAFTCSVWITNVDEADGRMIIGHVSNTAGWALKVQGVANSLIFRYSTGTEQVELVSNPQIYLLSKTNPHVAHHVGFRIDETGTKITFFIDGYIGVEQTLANALIIPDSDLILGGGIGHKTWKGNIEDVQLNDYLSDYEIRSLFEDRPISANEAVLS